MPKLRGPSDCATSKGRTHLGSKTWESPAHGGAPRQNSASILGDCKAAGVLKAKVYADARYPTTLDSSF